MNRTFLPTILAVLSWSAFAELPELPSKWKSTQPMSQKAAAVGDWWTVFHDAELTKLINEAKATYPGLKTVMARVEQARAAVKLARSDWFPYVSAGSDFGRSRSSDTVYDFSFGTLSNYGAALALSYEIDLWGRVKGNINAATADVGGAQANAYALGLVLSGEVARVYFALRSVDEEVGVLREALKLRHEALDLATAKVDAGAANELDRVRAAAELATAEAEIAAQAGPRAELENTLALALGRMASGYRVGEAKLPSTQPEVPKLVPSELIQRRPDIAEATRRMDAARARIGVARATYLPKLSLGAGVGLQSSQTDRVVDGDSGVWNVGLKFSIPLFIGGQKKAAVAAARAALSEVTGMYEEKVLTAFKEVESLMAKLEAQQKQSKAQAQLQDAADAAAKLARQRYKEGVTTYLEVIEAERTALSAKRAIVQLRGQRLFTTVQLIQALGGGWKAEP